MHLHILTGYAEFFRPAILPPEEIGEIAGPNIRPVSARWLSRECGDEYHDFLQEDPGDRRVAVLADAIRNDFGERFEPLLVLPELLTEQPAADEADKRSQLAVLSELLASGHFDHVMLYGLALAEDSDPDDCWAGQLGIAAAQAGTRLEQLCASLSGENDKASLTHRVVEVLPAVHCFDSLFNNALANALSCRLEPQLRSTGWRIEKPALATAIVEMLSELNDRGLFVEQPVGERLMQELASNLKNRLLQQ